MSKFFEVKLLRVIFLFLLLSCTFSFGEQDASEPTTTPKFNFCVSTLMKVVAGAAIVTAVVKTPGELVVVGLKNKKIKSIDDKTVVRGSSDFDVYAKDGWKMYAFASSYSLKSWADLLVADAKNHPDFRRAASKLGVPLDDSAALLNYIGVDPQILDKSSKDLNLTVSGVHIDANEIRRAQAQYKDYPEMDQLAKLWLEGENNRGGKFLKRVSYQHLFDRLRTSAADRESFERGRLAFEDKGPSDYDVGTYVRHKLPPSVFTNGSLLKWLRQISPGSLGSYTPGNNEFSFSGDFGIISNKTMQQYLDVDVNARGEINWGGHGAADPRVALFRQWTDQAIANRFTKLRENSTSDEALTKIITEMGATK
jgi:hypothetical protein